MSLFGRNPACKSLFAHSSPIFPYTTCQWCQFSPTWVLCVESTLILAFTPEGVHSCWDATLLRLPAGEGPLLPSIAFFHRVRSLLCAVSWTHSHLDIFTSSPAACHPCLLKLRFPRIIHSSPKQCATWYLPIQPFVLIQLTFRYISISGGQLICNQHILYGAYQSGWFSWPTFSCSRWEFLLLLILDTHLV